MAETYGPFDTSPWSQDQWFRFAGSWAPSGVLDVPAASSAAGALGITASGLTLTLAAGRAWVRGGGYENTTAKTITVPANATGNARIDRLVLRRDLAAKTITPVVVQGTPSATPVAPSPVQVEAGQWDTVLHRWTTPASSGTTLTGITDERAFIDPDYAATNTGTRLAAVEASVTDTGWQTLPPASGWFAVAPSRYRVKAGVCYVHGYLRNSGAGWATSATIATLPSGARPTPYDLSVTLQTNSIVFSAGIVTAGSGAIVVNKSYSGTNGELVFSFSFPVT